MDATAESAWADVADEMVDAVFALCTRTPTLASTLAYASVAVSPSCSEPSICMSRPTKFSSRSATIASALPLLLAGCAVLLTAIVSPLAGTPFRFSSKPLSEMGWPGVHVALPEAVTLPPASVSVYAKPPLASVKLIAALMLGSLLGLTTARPPTVAVPLLATPMTAVNGAAAAMPLGSSSVRVMLTAARPTGSSSNVSPGAGVPLNAIWNPSMLLPIAALSDRRVYAKSLPLGAIENFTPSELRVTMKLPLLAGSAASV